MSVIKNKNEILKPLLELWGFKDNLDIIEESITCETDREPHIWTINENYILKMTDNEYEMKNNISLSKLLSRENIPLQKVVLQLNGKEYACVENKFFGLFTKINGQVLKDYFQGDYKKRGFYLGQCLSALHRGLYNITDELKQSKELWDNNMVNELKGWVSKEIDKYLPNSKLSEENIVSFNEIYNYMKYNFEDLYLKLPRQVIHRDIHGENMIFQGEKLVGYIDFDLSQINARIYDVCYLCTGSLSSIFDDINKRNMWIEFAKNVIRGYESGTNITKEEKHSLKYMFYLIELIMIAYFAQNNYFDIADKNIEMINWINSVWDI